MRFALPSVSVADSAIILHSMRLVFLNRPNSKNLPNSEKEVPLLSRHLKVNLICCLRLTERYEFANPENFHSFFSSRVGESSIWPLVLSRISRSRCICTHIDCQRCSRPQGIFICELFLQLRALQHVQSLSCSWCMIVVGLRSASLNKFFRSSWGRFHDVSIS